MYKYSDKCTNIINNIDVRTHETNHPGSMLPATIAAATAGSVSLMYVRVVEERNSLCLWARVLLTDTSRLV